MRPVFILSIILLLVGCKQRDERVLMVDEQGSFAIGGTVLVDSLGHTYHGDHAYVFYQKPVDAQKYPLVFCSRSRTILQKRGRRHLTGARDSRISFCVGDSPRILSISLVGGMPGGERRQLLCRPFLMKRSGSTVFVSVFGLIFFDGVQFSRDKDALDQYFRQMTPTVGSVDFEVYSDAYAALFDKIGPAVFVTHSQGGPVGWRTLLKTKNIKGIVSYESRGGGASLYPKGQVPEEGKILTLSRKTEGVEVPMSDFMEYTKIPIVVYYGDNLPETDEQPELYEWTRRLYLMRKWAQMLNELGGNVTVVHLPEAGLHGNTHFPFSDLNNIEVADLLSAWLHEKDLD